MNKKISLVLLWIATILPAIAQQNIAVLGEIDVLQKGDPVSLLRVDGSDETVAGAVYSDTNFEMNFQASQSSLYMFYYGDEDGFLIVLHPGDTLKIGINKNEIVMEGSYENKMNSFVMMESNLLNEKYNELYEEYLSTEDIDKQVKINEEIDTLVARYNALIKSFVRNHPGSLLSLIYLEELNIDEDFEFFLSSCDSLMIKYPDNIYVIDLNSKVEGKKRLAIGNEAPEIELPDKDGKMLKLSDLKGNIVLIDFWASWCRPCRQESPNMVRIYQKYHKSGLVIYGVSLDKERQSWVDAIESDKLTWKHVSDLSCWESVVCADYAISGIPNTVLVDKEGRIIATGLRGEDLEAKLLEIFGF